MNLLKNYRAFNGRFCVPACCYLLLIISFAGCNSDQLPVHPVNGTVQFEDGSDVMFGDIEFFNAEHRVNARGKIKRDGTFTVGTYSENDGAVAGKHQVTILQVSGDYLSEKLSSQIKHDHGDLVDSAYFDYRTSGLNCDIEAGENEVIFVVKKAARQTSDGMPKK